METNYRNNNVLGKNSYMSKFQANASCHCNVIDASRFNSKKTGEAKIKVLILYFSATGNTAKIADVISQNLKEKGVDVLIYDITPLKKRQKKIDFTPYHAVIFGSPIHSRRAPRVVREWLKTLDGQGKKCSTFFTYGGFGVHPTHFSTQEILMGQNFKLVSSAEFLAAHTFNIGGWKALPERPNEQDYELAKKYTGLTYKRFISEDGGIVSDFEKPLHPEEKLDAIEKSRFKVVTQLPARNGHECSMCLKCEELCPTGAMNAEQGEANKDKCIACLGCVLACQEKVLKINDTSKSWAIKLGMEKITEEGLNELESKIYH